MRKEKNYYATWYSIGGRKHSLFILARNQKEARAKVRKRYGIGKGIGIRIERASGRG